MKRLIAALFLPLSFLAANDALDFKERFALAADRDAVLAELIPGTDDFYFYHALHAQNTAQPVAAQDALAKWFAAYEGRSFSGANRQRYDNLLRRQNLLLLNPQNPAEKITWLRHELGLDLHAPAPEANEQAQLHPTELDQTLISFDAFLNEAINQTDFTRVLDRASPTLLERLAARPMDKNQRQIFLKKITYPNLPNLVGLIAQDLADNPRTTFGEHPIHKKLTREQLAELLKAHPEIAETQAYVDTCLLHLAPPPDTPLPPGSQELFDHLAKIKTFADTLPPKFNTLRVPLYRHYLDTALALEKPDVAAFEAYLAMPRSPLAYAPRGTLDAWRGKGLATPPLSGQLELPLLDLPVLPPNDAALVDAYLLHVLKDEAGTARFAQWIDSAHLAQRMAEARLLYARPDADEWSRRLSPEQLQTLKDRAEINFPARHKIRFAAGEVPELKLELKNIPRLTLKIYDIDAAAFYRANDAEIATDIDLEGLVPNAERTFEYAAPPLHRHTETITLNELAAPGVYIVEAVGNGVASRALIRKGNLRVVHKNTAAGILFHLFDEKGALLKNGTLSMGSQSFGTSEKTGGILLPYAPSRKTESKKIVVESGRVARRMSVAHQDESYDLFLNLVSDSEAMLTGQPATVVLRPRLFINYDTPVDVTLLENAKLSVTSISIDGITSTHDVPVKLSTERDLAHAFFVPERTASITFTLSGSIRNLSQNKDETVSRSLTHYLDSMTHEPNQINFLLRRTSAGYHLDLRGLNGEPINGNVNLFLNHRFFDKQKGVICRTANGSLFLGPLQDISVLQAKYPADDTPNNAAKVLNAPEGSFSYGFTGPACGSKWQLPYFYPAPFQPRRIHVKAGENVTLPSRHAMRPEEPAHLTHALFAVPSDDSSASYLDDMTGRISLEENTLAIRGLPAGYYTLVDKLTGGTTLIIATDGADIATPGGTSYLAAPERMLEKSKEPLRVASIEQDAGAMTVKLNHSSPRTRVHFIARRLVNLPPGITMEGWVEKRPGLGVVNLPDPFGAYTAGRVIGDETRYIMERRHLSPQTGVMLDRPSLLLSPWSLRDTATDVIDAKSGAEWSAARASSMRSAGDKARDAQNALPYLEPLGSRSPGDFLAKPALLLANLEPRGNIISVPLEQLAGYTEVIVYAVDENEMDMLTATLPDAPWQTRDLCHKPPFDAAVPVAQQRTVTPVPAGQPFALPQGAEVSAAESFDSLERLFAFFQALRNDAEFAKFDFLCAWQGLDAATKRAKYNEFACHELNFFLYQKDRDFFNDVVRPFLANKRDKQLVDDFLLGNNLTPYTVPAKFKQLNTFEKILLARAGGTPITPATIVRDITEAVAVMPVDAAADERVFNTALNASAGLMSASGGVDFFGGAELSGRINAAKMVKSPALARSRAAAPAAARAEKPMDAFAMEEPAEIIAFAVADDVSDRSLREEAKQKQLYRSPGVTKEWVETHYWKTPLENINAAFITPSRFWRDVAQHQAGAFLPASVADAARSATERLLALALVDLPFAAPEKVADKPTFPSEGNAIVFAEYTMRAESADAETTQPLLVVQNVFDKFDRFEPSTDNTRIEKLLTQKDEFYNTRAYGLQVIVSNPNSRPRKLRLLAQIPEGAIPLGTTRALFSQPIELDAFDIRRVELFFYFPNPGKFTVLPAAVSEAGAVVARAGSFVCDVRALPSEVRLSTWQEVARNGTIDQVLAFLETQNLHDKSIDFNVVRFRLADRAFYEKLSEFLESRLVFNRAVADFAFRHNDLPRVAAYLERFRADFLKSLGPRFTSPLVSYDAETARDFEHKEYWPLVNARAHPLKQKRTIANQEFATHYGALMDYLAFTPARSDRDTLTLACALLLQDRVQEARAFFDTIDPAKLDEQMQHTYAKAYLLYAEGKLADARALAAPLADYPMPRWRNFFATMLAHIDEAEGKPPAGPDAENLAQQLHLMAATTPALDIALNAATLTIRPAAVKSVEVRYYPLDIENLFSRTPFLASAPEGLGHIRPARVVTLQAGAVAIDHPVPPDLASRNLLIEITAPGTPLAKRLSYTPNTMALHVIEPYGQLRVRTQKDDKPLAGAYVKVYAKDARDNAVFYKDGYTDPRGAFDYASLSTEKSLGGAQRFALLILHPEHGAILAEAAPPPR